MITRPNCAAAPRTDEMFDWIGNASFYSILGLKTGFHQIRIATSKIEKTAFNTKYGHFGLLVMPTRLRNAPATFHSLMNSIFYDVIDDFLDIYLDHLLIYSNSRKDHLKYLHLVLDRRKAKELFVGKEKYELATIGTEFLDFAGLLKRNYHRG